MFKSLQDKSGDNKSSENKTNERKTSENQTNEEKTGENNANDKKTSEKSRVRTNEEMKHIIAAARKSTNSLKRARRELGLYLSNYERTPLFGKREITMKICVVGDFGVGKTSIVRQYCYGMFNPNYQTTVGADFAIKTLQYDENTRLNLQLWDIAGNERFGHHTSVYYRYAVGALIVFDVTRAQTFTSVLKWLEDIRSRTILQSGKDIPVILIGNKADMTFTEHVEGQKQYCEKHRILDVFHTSARNDINLNMAMETLIDEMVKNHFDRDEDSINLLDTPEAAPTKGCCFI